LSFWAIFCFIHPDYRVIRTTPSPI
jgi:hypothetical protein